MPWFYLSKNKGRDALVARLTKQNSRQIICAAIILSIFFRYLSIFFVAFYAYLCKQITSQQY